MKNLSKLLFLLLPLSILSCKKETISTIKIDSIETWNSSTTKSVKVRIKKEPNSPTLYESPIILFGGSQKSNITVNNLEFTDTEAIFIVELVEATNNKQVCIFICDLRNSLKSQRSPSLDCDVIIYFTRYDKSK